MAKHIKLFYHRVATPFYFIRIKRYGNILTGTPLRGRRMQTAYEKIAIFLLYLGIDIVAMALCIRRTLCRRDDWHTNGNFCCFDCLLTVFDCF